MSNKITVGVFEKVDFPEFGITGMTAKMDTGAYKGSFHCTKVYVENDGGKQVLYFSPFDRPDKVFHTNDFKLRKTKSSNGHEEMRYVINTPITVRGKTYPIMISLANRSNMKWQVLVGRRFLRHNNMIIDPTLKKGGSK